MADEKLLQDELLSDEQLDEVIGGSIGNCALDSRFLYEHGLMDNFHSADDFFNNWESYYPELQAAWKKAGIFMDSQIEFPNSYFAGSGNRISWEEASKIVSEKFPKIRSVPKKFLE